MTSGLLPGPWLLSFTTLSLSSQPVSPPTASDCLEALYNGGGCEWVCREAFWKHRPCLQTSCVLQCYLQNRKLCPIFATHILCLRVHGGAGAGHFSGAGRELFRQPGEVGVLPATRKNKQTIFAKIIHVTDSLVAFVYVSPACWYPTTGAHLPGREISASKPQFPLF